MSAAIIPRRRGRRPKLKVVGGEPRPRRRCMWSDKPPYLCLEVWTVDEWATLADWERPANAQWMPGIGHVAVGYVADEEESKGIVAELHDAQEFWKSYR